MPPSRRLGTTEEVAAYLGKSKRTLDNWRHLDIGPPYVKTGPGKYAQIRYHWADVEKWLSRNAVSPGQTA